MRTVSFKSVYDAILQRLGLDPLGDAVTYDTARAICEHVTERAASAWVMWDWPQLTVTDERGYRDPWYFDVHYDSGDEVYYPPTQKYYKVKAGRHPPRGNPPTTAFYWQVLDPVTTFIDRDQNRLSPIGKVIGVYKSDPSLNGCAPHDICLKFRPSERGTYLCYAPATTVYVCFVPPPPIYTMVPWIAGRQYLPGDRVFYDPQTTGLHRIGDVYLCLATTTSVPPGNASFWVKEPVPDIFASYLKAGAAADCLKETFATGEDQVRMARAAALDAEADGYIHSEIDDLLAQGQKHYYIKPYWSDGWCLSEPWLGSTVTRLFTIFDPSTPTIPDLDLDVRITSSDDFRVTTTGDFRVPTTTVSVRFTSFGDIRVTTTGDFRISEAA